MTTSGFGLDKNSVIEPINNKPSETEVTCAAFIFPPKQTKFIVILRGCYDINMN